MKPNNSFHEQAVTYIENCLTEAKLLHDPSLIGPTLEQLHIQQSHARISGLTPGKGTFRPRVGFKPRAVYTVLDTDGTPLGEPIHEDDLSERYAETEIKRAIFANNASIHMDHADLVALYRTGGGGAAPSFRYKPASGLAERSDTEADLERQLIAYREKSMLIRQQTVADKNALAAVRIRIQQAEQELAETRLSHQRTLVQQKRAQQVIDRAAHLQRREALKRGDLPSPWDTTAGKEDAGLSL